MAERPSGMREHKPHIRYATFSIFCYFRSQLLIDSLADLFMKLTHQLQTKSESFVDKKILSEVKCVDGKFDILYKLSVSASENPTGVIQEIIYPQVGQEILKNLAKELYFKGKWYQTQVHMKMHSLYSHASRKMLLALLDSFTLKTNLNASIPLINGIQTIKHTATFSTNFTLMMRISISKKWFQMNGLTRLLLIQKMVTEKYIDLIANYPFFRK